MIGGMTSRPCSGFAATCGSLIIRPCSRRRPTTLMCSVFSFPTTYRCRRPGRRAGCSCPAPWPLCPQSMNGRLMVVHGRPESVLPRLAAEIGAAAVHASADYGPYGRRRDDQGREGTARPGHRLGDHGLAVCRRPGPGAQARWLPVCGVHAVFPGLDCARLPRSGWVGRRGRTGSIRPTLPSSSGTTRTVWRPRFRPS